MSRRLPEAFRKPYRTVVSGPRLFAGARFLAAGVALLLAALMLPLSSARAEDAVPDGRTPPDLTTLGIEELMGIEVETVSSASKYEQPVTEAPASVSIVTADEIRKFGYRTLADILQSLPGFSVTNDRNYQYAGLRGFGFPGDYGNRILLLVDGVRINDPIYQSFAIGNDFIADVDLIERVEVVRGPSYTLYGSNAMLGVVNVITKRGRDLGGAELSGSAASFDGYAGRASYGSLFASGPEALISGTYGTSRGQDLFFPAFNAPSTNFGWARGCDGENYGSAFLKVLYHDLTLEGAYVKREKTLPTAPWESAFNNPGTETWDSRAFLDLKYRHTFADELDLMARISYNYYGNDGRYIYDISDPGSRPLLLANIDYGRVSWLSGEVQATKEVWGGHKLVGGVEFQDILNMVQQNRDIAVHLDDRRSAWNIGVYLQDEYQLLDTLILDAGVRYDYFDTFGGTVNPRAALIYSPFSSTTLKFLFGTGFRAPNGYELYYGDRSTMKPNPFLREERSTSYELVLEQYFGKRFRGSVTGIYTRVKDLITQLVDPFDGLLTYANVTDAEIKGLELELDGKWANGVGGRLSYTYQDGRNITTGEWLTNSARHLVKLNLLIPLVRDRLSLGLEEQYTSGKRTLNRSVTGDFFVTNLTLLSRNLLPNLEISGSIYNLFNSGYSAPGGGEHLQDSIEQDGRSFRVKLTWRF
jgi:iron complex outermembrane receptor protein